MNKVPPSQLDILSRPLHFNLTDGVAISDESKWPEPDERNSINQPGSLVVRVLFLRPSMNHIDR